MLNSDRIIWVSVVLSLLIVALVFFIVGKVDLGLSVGSNGNINTVPSNSETEYSLEGVSEDSVAKLWFDVRQEGSTKQQLDELRSQISEFLEVGKIPMVVEKFPLTLITSEDYGFHHNILWTRDYPINLITLVSPPWFKDTDRVTNFVMVDYPGSVESFIVDGVGLVPSSFGMKEEGNTMYHLVGGDYVNEDILTNKGEVGLFVLVSDDKGVRVSHIEGNEHISLADADIVVEDNKINIKTTTPFPVFFYNEFEGEGQSTGDLFLITSNNDNSHLYKIDIEEGKVGIKLEEISGR